MTLDELLNLVRRISNSAYCRYWAHWNYPHEQPWLMAVAAVDFNGEPVLLDELLERGFNKVMVTGKPLYTIERTDGDGGPFSVR